MKFAILITWKNGEQQIYPTLTKFVGDHNVAPINTINNHISRKKQPFVCDECTIQKIEIKRDN